MCVPYIMAQNYAYHTMRLKSMVGTDVLRTITMYSDYPIHIARSHKIQQSLIITVNLTMLSLHQEITSVFPRVEGVENTFATFIIILVKLCLEDCVSERE